QDDKYERHGTRAIFMFFAPLLGCRRAVSREHRTRTDWAQEIKRLLDEDFPLARKVHLVCDNLNTHHIASLYEAFPAEEAHRLAARLNIAYTSRHHRWLHVAETELSFLFSQCLDLRISNTATPDPKLQPWILD